MRYLAGALAGMIALASLADAQRSRPVDRLPWKVRADEQQVEVVKARGWEDPPAPPAEREGVDPPRGGRLNRDAYQSGRFTQAGQNVRYPFAAEAGELCVFELCTWGYARGWSSEARMRVLDEGGRVLAESRSSGGTVYRDLLLFHPSTDGRYRLELTAVAESFRYVLLRHADYEASLRPSRVGPEGVARGVYDGERPVRYSIELSPGRTYELQVLPSQEPLRSDLRVARRGQGGGGMMMDMSTLGERQGQVGMSMSEEAAALVPIWAQVRADGRSVTGRGHYHLFQVEEAGTYEVVVSAGTEPALFDLLLARELETVDVHGVVCDTEDRPRAEVTLRFLREPDMDPVASVHTDAQGRYALALPPGDYSIYLSGTTRAAEVVRTRILEGRELNLIHAPTR